MKRKRIDFRVDHPLVRRTVRNLRIEKEFVDTVQIQGVGYMDPNSSLLDSDRFSASIDHIWWEGRDLYPILDAVGALEDFESAAHRHVVGLFMASAVA